MKPYIPGVKKPHVGMHAYRLKVNAGNPMEVAFSKQWSQEQEQGHVLAHLIGKDFSDRDAEVAATVIQWLGSNVGMSFLEEAIIREPKISKWLGRRAVK